MVFDYFEQILILLKSALWPLTVIFGIWYLKDNIKDLFIKHKDTEIKLVLKEVNSKKKESVKIVNEIEKIISKSNARDDIENIKKQLRKVNKLTTEIAGTKENILSTLSGIAESNENANGKYTKFNNGIVSVEILFQPGQLNHDTAVTFPVAIKTESVSVTFVGRDTPKIVSIDKFGMTLSLKEPNSSSIKAIIQGVCGF